MDQLLTHSSAMSRVESVVVPVHKVSIPHP